MLLVTGATGFVGRHVVQALLAAGNAPVRCLTHRHSQALEMKAPEAEAVTGDVLDLDSLRDAMGGVETVVHLIGIIRERGKEVTLERINHGGVTNVVEAARGAGVRHIVHMSALGVQADPRYGYYFSKWQGEQEVTHSGLSYTILRPSLQFGSGDEFFNTLAAVARLFPMVPVAGRGRNLFQPIAVEDVAQCVALAVGDATYQGRTIEIGGPRQYTYDELLTLIFKTLKVRRMQVHVPVAIMRLVAGMMELFLPRPPVTREQLKYLDLDNVTDIDSVEQAFGFTPRSLEENLEYIRSVGWREAVSINAGFMPGDIRDH